VSSISILCACGSQSNVPSKYAGRRIRCPQCQQSLKVPGRTVGPQAPSVDTRPRDKQLTRASDQQLTVANACQREPENEPFFKALGWLFLLKIGQDLLTGSLAIALASILQIAGIKCFAFVCFARVLANFSIGYSFLLQRPRAASTARLLCAIDLASLLVLAGLGSFPLIFEFFSTLSAPRLFGLLFLTILPVFWDIYMLTLTHIFLQAGRALLTLPTETNNPWSRNPCFYWPAGIIILGNVFSAFCWIAAPL